MKTRKRVANKNLDHLRIIDEYAAGDKSVTQIAKEHGTSEENVSLIATRFWKKLTNMKEARALITDTKDCQKVLKSIEKIDSINTDFLSLLSSDTDKLLTEEESIYAWVYTHTGSQLEAIKEAKLDIGIHREKGKDFRYSYDRACNLRSLYLNSKSNVAQYIKELREVKYKDTNVGKSRIQGELIDQLDYLKASDQAKNRKEILRCIELLGKTVGAFTERIEVREISPGDALDELIEMAKDAEIRAIDEDSVYESE